MGRRSGLTRLLIWVKKYWPLGPFPAVFILPFVFIFGTAMLQGFISFALTVLNFYLLFQLAKKFRFSQSDAIWLAAFFIFGSVYLAVAVYSVSWYFAQVVAVTALLLALDEYFKKKRYWLIGSYLACAIATRSNLILAVIFFGLGILGEAVDWRSKVKKLIILFSPIAAAILLLLIYNFLRFGNPLETGYNLQDIAPIFATARSYGLFTLRHIPGNLFFLLFRGPDPVRADPGAYVLAYPYIVPNIWGMSIFFTSPLFLYLFSASWKSKITRAAGLTSLAILLTIITYYGIGTAQIGYRYALDFYPFLYLILCEALSPKLPAKAKILIVLGIILDWYFVLNFSS